MAFETTPSPVSAEWRAMRVHIHERIKVLQEELESIHLSHDDTLITRGRIAELRQLSADVESIAGTTS